MTKAELEKVEALEKDNQALSSRVQELDADNTKLKAEVDKLRSKVEELESQYVTSQEVDELNNQLKSRVEELEGENAALKVVDAATVPSEPEKPTSLDSEERSFTLDKTGYVFADVASFWFGGVKNPIESVKDTDMQQKLVKADHPLLKKL